MDDKVLFAIIVVSCVLMVCVLTIVCHVISGLWCDNCGFKSDWIEFNYKGDTTDYRCCVKCGKIQEEVWYYSSSCGHCSVTEQEMRRYKWVDSNS